jgi:predicted TPR repeat methyltransferase
MPSFSSGNLLADRRFEYARGYAAECDHGAAVDLFNQTLELVPDWLAALSGLADARAALGEIEAASAILTRIAGLDPAGVFGAPLRLAALGLAPMPSSPPEAYVRDLFDDYADRFESALVDTLDYQTPWQLADAVFALRPGGFPRALDLGCGTGLMGQVIRDRTGYLEGVDLSPGMLEQARVKGLYDHLAIGDVLAHLHAAKGRFDLIVAADVFVYVGDLADVFQAVARRLNPGGIFAFSVEAGEGDALILRDSLRYAHGPGYIDRLAADAHLRTLRRDSAALRLDRGRPVDGFLIVMSAMDDV